MKINSYMLSLHVFKLEIMHAADEKKLMNGFIFIQAHTAQALKSTLEFVQMEPRAVRTFDHPSIRFQCLRVNFTHQLTGIKWKV